jgi:pimeloyl-ACP methyl ester carboxylesterase
MDLHTKSQTRILGPGRIVALLVITLIGVGLGYLRFAPNDTVSVPAGAKAGDLTLKNCKFATEDGGYAADCGTLVVPENRADPHSRLIALPVTRIRARSGASAEPIFRLEGGPGVTNMEFPMASRFAQERDVVMVGYRGVDGSSKLDCPEVESALKHSEDFLEQKSLHAYSDAMKSCSERLHEDGVDLAGYTLPQRVDDLEAARRALGYDRVDLLSDSAGTRTAMIYSWRHPKSVNRSVMIGVNPPGHFLWDPERTDRQLKRYSTLCSRDDACAGRTDDLAASIQDTAAHMPDHWGFLPIEKGNARIASFYGLMQTTSEAAPLSAPITLDSWLSAAHGDPSGFWFLSLMADLSFPESFVWGDVAASAQGDFGAADKYFSRPRDLSNVGGAATEFLWGGGGLSKAWPVAAGGEEYSRVRNSDTQTLLIGGTLDFATPFENARDELLPHLANGHQVVLDNFGHSTDFWNYQTKAGTRLVNTYFRSGKVDDSLYKPRDADFSTEVTQTALAKGLAAGMVGFGLLTALSLMWMPFRIRRRGRYGRKAAASLRALYPIVLGLGGWFLAALTALVLWPTLPLDNQALGVLSIGTPIGLGIYWAWVDWDWAKDARRWGFLAAAGGALLGAWLGFNATTGLLALITSILGAAAAANLALLVYDVLRARSARSAATRPYSDTPQQAGAVGEAV